MVDHQDHQDMGDGMQCSNHPYTKNPGGICAFCLQEKLGKLVSSSFPLPKQVSPSSSSSPSFRSDSIGSSTSVAGNLSSTSLALSLSVAKSANNGGNEGYYYNNGRASKLPFLLAKKKKKIMAASSSTSSSSAAADRAAGVVFKRSKSTTTPRTAYGEGFSPRKRGGFWSFLHITSSKHQNHSNGSNRSSAGKKADKIHARISQMENGFPRNDNIDARMSVTENGSSSSSSKKGGNVGINVIVEEDGSPNPVVTEAATAANGSSSGSSFERKVSRSRSVGCGSRSFSGDFFERISNGFGDCTLRRVESQREGKPKVSNNGNHNNPNVAMREMVRCGGIFSGFMIMTSSSSSSSSSATWVSSSSTSASSADHLNHDVNGIKPGSSLAHGRNRSWAWAFASPMRAFSGTNTSTNNKASSSAGKDGKRGRTITESSNKNTTPNLDAIPSLLAVRS